MKIEELQSCPPPPPSPLKVYTFTLGRMSTLLGGTVVAFSLFLPFYECNVFWMGLVIQEGKQKVILVAFFWKNRRTGENMAAFPYTVNTLSLCLIIL